HLAWRAPRRRRRLRDQLAGWTLREAEVLGLTGLGALSSHGRALLSGQDATARLAKVLPEPVDHVLIQADLTAIAPGPLVTELARELALMADVESTGGATVFRFTPGSVRRALDAGRSAAELADLLTRHSATPVPQSLTYLIEDMARRHGHLRVGTASAYVRTDDPATLDEILADRRAEVLRLHRLAPTVLASRLSRSELLDALRTMGFAPVAESSAGGVVVTRLDAHRAESPHRHHLEPAMPGTRSVDPSMIAAAVRALRAGDEAARLTLPAGEPPRTPSMATVDELRAAVERGARVWIGYLDQQGQASSRIVEPARVEGGFLTAYDATRASVQRFALHRITGIAEVDRTVRE
ncbi:MAG: helicase-associated domain-containing protein, partial [Actinomadura sp.]